MKFLTPYVASLRIFEPISAFPAADRLRWESVDITADSRRAEQALALQRLIAPEPPALRPDGAHFLEIVGALSKTLKNQYHRLHFHSFCRRL